MGQIKKKPIKMRLILEQYRTKTNSKVCTGCITLYFVTCVTPDWSVALVYKSVRDKLIFLAVWHHFSSVFTFFVWRCIYILYILYVNDS